MSDALGYLTPVVPETKTEPWRDVLMRAADYIEAHGWCQHNSETPEGRVCLMGAISRVAGIAPNGPFSQHASHVVHKAAWKMHMRRQNAQWNDERGRTVAEVCAALRSCATS